MKNDDVKTAMLTERTILKDALGVLQATTGVMPKIVERRFTFIGGEPDAVIELNRGGDKVRCVAEIKRTILPTAVGHIVAQLQRFKGPKMLVTRYVTPQIAEQLKKLNVGFIDAAGNAYINTPHLFIYIAGRKAREKEGRAREGTAFRPTGLQVIFALLCRPELIKQPYREIARAANVALGTVGLAMDDLQQLNYVVDRGNLRRKLVNTKGLLDTWVTLYGQRLRPKRLIGRFRGPTDAWWKGQKIELPKMTYLGGEPAAAVLTGYLKPEMATIYAAGNVNQFLLKNRLRRDAEGNVEILKTFWHFDYPWHYKQLTPPLLIYADLLATADERNIETGKLIYEKYLAGPFGQN